MLPIYCSEGERQKLRMKNAFIHIKTYIFRGLIAVIPLALTVFVIQFLYLAIDQRIMGLVDEFIGFRIPGLGIVLQLNVLYLIGFIASNVVSRKIFGFAERITERIPLINTTYHVGKQLSATQAFQGEGFMVKEASQDLAFTGMNPYFGGVHALAREGNKWCGAGDPPRDGVVQCIHPKSVAWKKTPSLLGKL